MRRFRQMKTLQKFRSVHAAFHNHFNQDRHPDHLIEAGDMSAVWSRAACARTSRIY